MPTSDVNNSEKNAFRSSFGGRQKIAWRSPKDMRFQDLQSLETRVKSVSFWNNKHQLLGLQATDTRLRIFTTHNIGYKLKLHGTLLTRQKQLKNVPNPKKQYEFSDYNPKKQYHFLDQRIFSLPLQKISCTRQFESELSLHSFV